MYGKKNVNKIFCVDDDKHLGELYRIGLELRGFTVVSFDHTEKVLEVLDREKPLLLITNLMMPGISGYELVTRIRRKWSKTELPIIAMCKLDLAQCEKMHPGLEEKINAFLLQPVSPQELADTIMNIYRKRKG
ncbi:response regulator [candidate division FCPU426 bacterium]|nr:response regulator [candidate division FCPU426 bacterium]